MNPVADHQQVTTVSFCWIVERLDGAGLALTNLDRILKRSGLAFNPGGAFRPSAIVRGDADATTECSGALNDQALTRSDLAAGRWDGARMTLQAIDWHDGAAEPINLSQGQIGEVTLNNIEFSAELLGGSAVLGAPACPLTTPECRAELGDKQCRVDLASRRKRVTVVSAEGSDVKLQQNVDQRYCSGEARWLTGRNSGLRNRVMVADGNTLVLRDVPSFPVEVGDALLVTEGCDKRLATCSERFGNVMNFRGEPHLPGNDLLTRYPGA